MKLKKCASFTLFICKIYDIVLYETKNTRKKNKDSDNNDIELCYLLQKHENIYKLKCLVNKRINKIENLRFLLLFNLVFFILS